MFCMNCGQQLPDGAKFCFNCGTPQGAISPTGTTQIETINLDGMHTFVPAMCPNCNANMKVDTSIKVARCNACGTECLVQDAIKALSLRGVVQVGNATINVSSTNIDALLLRIKMMLESREFAGIKSRCDSILDLDPTNAKAYFYLLLDEHFCRNGDDLINSCAFDRSDHYKKAMKYADPEFKKELQYYTEKFYARKDVANIKNLRVGCSIRFGNNDFGQKAFWEILKIQDDKLLIIWMDETISAPYHDQLEDVKWENCTLRKWLNNGFIQSHFTTAEQEKILPCTHNTVMNPNISRGNQFPRRFASKVNDDSNSKTKNPGDVTTTDKVFLLSENELQEFKPGDQYISSRGKMLTSWDWWLRSPAKGNIASCARHDSDYGGYYLSSSSINERLEVRPALWLKIDS